MKLCTFPRCGLSQWRGFARCRVHTLAKRAENRQYRLRMRARGEKAAAAERRGALPDPRPGARLAQPQRRPWPFAAWRAHLLAEVLAALPARFKSARAG
jgi:hypothetical protein